MKDKFYPFRPREDHSDFLKRTKDDFVPSKSNRKKVSKTLRRKVYERDKWICLKCGSGEDLTIDHIVPVILDGLTLIDNLQTLCSDCNLKKGEKIISYLKDGKR